ncbi:substrate-binding periplasmic protein [Thalassospira tepidiphila]|uniref:Solute-binding protein family 3/N-terminal domain-containing protein n=2 Tax=Thalassospira tepidiphila TaxID=393657 RepID=A0A853KVI8_9PROT|nr:hypothetical protein [Thalassospira tepidiphila]NJB76018.1 hypothetical protein [Thalassospira tepidiphila]OAZ07955.1 hypothetical protein TH4_19320 [Thalassospira tepidiphila MCCC 1A03514]
MASFQLHTFLRNCALTLFCLAALLVSFAMLPGAKAKQPCLRIAIPEATIGDTGHDIYQAAMNDAGLCVEPVLMPHARTFMAMRHKQIDGVFAMLETYGKTTETPVIRGSVILGKPDGMFVVKKDGPKTLSELTSEQIGVWLGTGWSEKLLEHYEHVVPIAGGPELMMEMLVKGRLDGILLNDYSLRSQGGAPEGFVAIPVANLAVYSFLRAEHAEQMAKFDNGTVRFREKIAAFRKDPS